MLPVESILKDALALSVAERAELVGQLQRTLPAPPAAPSPRASREMAAVVVADDTPITWEGAQGFLED
jgi:hypothetical protein